MPGCNVSWFALVGRAVPGFVYIPDRRVVIGVMVWVCMGVSGCTVCRAMPWCVELSLGLSAYLIFEWSLV